MTASPGMFSPEEVANSLLALAKLGLNGENELAEAISKQAAETASTFDAQEVATTLWSLATLRMDGAAAAAAVAALTRRIKDVIESFEASDVVNALWALEVLGADGADAAVTLLAKRVAEHAAILSPQDVTITLVVLEKLRGDGAKEAALALAQRASTTAKLFSKRQGERVQQALSELGLAEECAHAKAFAAKLRKPPTRSTSWETVDEMSSTLWGRLGHGGSRSKLWPPIQPCASNDTAASFSSDFSASFNELDGRSSELQEIIMLQGAIWLVGFKWSFIFKMFERPRLTRALWCYCFCQGLQIAALYVRRAEQGGMVSGRDLMRSIVFFCFSTSLIAYVLHVLMGGWQGSVYVLMWPLTTVLMMILYEVPLKIRNSIIGFYGILFFSDMAVEFKVVEMFPEFIANVMHGIYDGVRLVVQPEPIPGIPALDGIMACNNFFSPMFLLIYCMSKVVSQRREWQERSDRVLYNLVPPEIANKLRRGVPGSKLTQHHAGVTCFFSDIVGYTSMCDKMQDPAHVIEILDMMFSAFDTVAELTGAYKVETIGDAYFAVATLNNKAVSTEESCYRMAVFALAVRDFISGEFGQKHCLMVRCGLHTGDLVTGILGNARPRYVLVGDTVNTASRMESSGVPNTVNISEATAQHLAKFFHMTDRGPTEVKGKGAVRMFALGDCKDEFKNGAFGLHHSPMEIAEIASQRLRDYKVSPLDFCTVVWRTLSGGGSDLPVLPWYPPSVRLCVSLAALLALSWFGSVAPSVTARLSRCCPYLCLSVTARLFSF
jgi:class 3 adenylate cyclase